MSANNPSKRRLTWSAVAIVLVAVVYFLTPIVKLAIGLNKRGFFDAPKAATYVSSTRANLLALYTAMMFVHESDGQFPDDSKWMDAIQHNLKSDTLKTDDAAAKLHDPSLGASPDVYGFAMNDACSGKYKGDLPTGTILIFTSQATGRNAHGNPKTDSAKPPRASLGVTIEGKIVSEQLTRFPK